MGCSGTSARLCSALVGRGLAKWGRGYGCKRGRRRYCAETRAPISSPDPSAFPSLRVCLFVCLLVCLFVCLFVRFQAVAHRHDGATFVSHVPLDTKAMLFAASVAAWVDASLRRFTRRCRVGLRVGYHVGCGAPSFRRPRGAGQGAHQAVLRRLPGNLEYRLTTA